jgi:CcmD family protein
VTGVVVSFTTDTSGGLASFDISDASGNRHTFTVRGGATPTEYGLENQAGDRWVSNQADEPVEAVRRIEDHQRRFAPVTVQASGGVALSVVESEASKLETNLGYLFAVFGISWVGFFAYIWYLSQRQRDLRREVARLQQAISRGDDRPPPMAGGS